MRTIIFTLLNLLLIGVAIWGLWDARNESTPPGEEVSSLIKTIIARVDSERLLSSIDALSSETTRRFGSPGSEHAVGFITETLLDMGCDVEHQYLDIVDGNRNTATITNVIADLPGSRSSGDHLILCAHYDSKVSGHGEAAPGADDNASGVAVILEIARVLIEADIVMPLEMVFFGGEEDSLLGSKAFTQHLETHGTGIIGAINVDMVGYDETGPKDFVVFTNEFSTDLAEALQICASTYTSLRSETDHLESANSDNGSFWESGFKAVSVWEGYDHNPVHHTADDTPDRLSPEFIVDITRVVLCAAVRLGGSGDVVAWMNVQSGVTCGWMDPGSFRVRHLGRIAIGAIPGTRPSTAIVGKQDNPLKMAP